MAWYLNPKDVALYDGPHEAEFEKRYKPGLTPVLPGIYRCTFCGKECVCESDRPLPDSGPNHIHDVDKPGIAWKLIVTEARR